MGGEYRGGIHLEQNGEHFSSARAPLLKVHDLAPLCIDRRFHLRDLGLKLSNERALLRIICNRRLLLGLLALPARALPLGVVVGFGSRSGAAPRA